MLDNILMYTYLNNKVSRFLNSFGNKNITINVNDFSKYKVNFTEKVKEKYISDIIHNYKLRMDNIPFNVLRDLCEILTMYDVFEQYYEHERFTKDYVKKINCRLNQVKYIPRKIKAQIINDKFELLKLMEIPDGEVDPSEHLILYRALIMKFFLRDKTLKENLLKIQYVYIEIDNYNLKYSFQKHKIYNKKNFKIKRGYYYQPLINQILKFYFHNKLYYDPRQEFLPIIGWKNNIPVLDPAMYGICISRNFCSRPRPFVWRRFFQKTIES